MYESVDVNIDNDILKAAKKTAKENGVSVNQIFCDCLAVYIIDSIFKDEKKWEQLRKEFTKKKAPKDTMKIVKKVFKEFI